MELFHIIMPESRFTTILGVTLTLPGFNVYCVANNFDHAKRQAKDVRRELQRSVRFGIQWGRGTDGRDFVLGHAAVKEYNLMQQPRKGKR